MTINPQYTFDTIGNPTGVFIGIKDWEAITNQLKLELKAEQCE